MFKFLRRISKLLFMTSMMCFVAQSDKTMDDYSKEADVFFDVQKKANGLELIGRESGKDVFRTVVQNFSNFSDFSQGSFQVQRLQNSLHWRYSPTSSEEFFEVIVKQNGDISLGDLPQNYAGFDHYKTFAFRTLGILENRGSQAFYKLVLSANQFHNYGTIQTWSYHFFQDYHFNSGMIKSGVIPKVAMDLRSSVLEVAPSYKYGIIENYGDNALIGNLHINDGLSLINHGLMFTSGDLKMSGGDIFSDKSILIQGKLSGAVRDIKISSGACHIGYMEIEKLRNLIVESNGVFDLGHFGLREAEAFIVGKEAVVRAIGEVAFAVTKTLDVKGIILGTEQMMILPPKFLKEVEELRKKVDEMASEIEKAQVEAMMEAYSGRRRHGGGLTFKFGVGTGGMHFRVHTIGYTPDFTPIEEDLRKKFGGPLYGTSEPLLKVLLEAKKEVIKNDPSFVTPKLVPVKTANGDSKELKRLQQSIEASRPSVKTPSLPAFCNKVAGEMKRAGASSELTANRDYFSRLYEALHEVSIPHSDIATICGHPYLETVKNWDRLSPVARQDIERAHPGIGAAGRFYNDTIKEFKSECSEYASLSSTDQQFINEGVTDLSAEWLLLLCQPARNLATAKAFVSDFRTKALQAVEKCSPRLDITRSLSNFFKKKFDEKFGKKTEGSDPSKARSGDRVQSSKSDLDSFVQKKIDSGICPKWKVVNGRQTYKFNKSDGIFKKGDLITKDTRHYEAEWWSPSGTHKGAVEPVKETQYRGSDSTKHLDID